MMKIFNKKIVATLIVALIVSQFSFVYALEWRAEDLAPDEQKAFVTRTEFTNWVTAFTASLSEVDKNATQKIFDNMDFYDLQYKITIVYDYNANSDKWYSNTIERPEGTYSPGGTEKFDLKQQLENFRNHAVQWEKYRRGLVSSHPTLTEQSHNSAGYVFTPKP